MAKRFHYSSESDSYSSESNHRSKRKSKNRRHRDRESSSEVNNRSHRKSSKHKKYGSDDVPAEKKYIIYENNRSKSENGLYESHFASQKDLEKLKSDMKVQELQKKINYLESELYWVNKKYDKLKLKQNKYENSSSCDEVSSRVSKKENPKPVDKQKQQPKTDERYIKKKGQYEDKCCLDC